VVDDTVAVAADLVVVKLRVKLPVAVAAVL
jgi:hypothetical protein